jgi:hypothetical protein
MHPERDGAFMTGATIQGHGAANHFSHVASHHHAPGHSKWHSADGDGAGGFAAYTGYLQNMV